MVWGGQLGQAFRQAGLGSRTCWRKKQQASNAASSDLGGGEDGGVAGDLRATSIPTTAPNRVSRQAGC